jgi:hypothetical protein
MSDIPTVTRNALANLIADAADAGSTYDHPYLSVQTSAHVEVAKCEFTDTTAFGDAATGVCTANTIDDDDDADGGEATHVDLCDQDGTVIITGDLGTTASYDFQILATTIGEHDTVQFSACTITVPASS